VNAAPTIVYNEFNMQLNCKSTFLKYNLQARNGHDRQMQCERISQYSQLIGVLRWAVELGQLNIYTKVALFSHHLALPRVGHLEAVYHVFAYLNKHDKSHIVFDPTDPLPHTPTAAKPDWSFLLSHRIEITTTYAGAARIRSISILLLMIITLVIL
jgi:hypothetical protein